MEVVLVDAGGTNIGSVQYALERMGVSAPVTADAERIRAASHVILPGVGAATQGMRRLRESGLAEVIPTLTQPVLGVCLGMQLLFEHSEEGDVACLGLLPGRVARLVGKSGLRVPHMGWNRLAIERDDALLDGVDAGAFAYFVHGYAVPVNACTLASSEHGIGFAAVVRRNNFCGMQFHPERSGQLGARLLANFLSLKADATCRSAPARDGLTLRASGDAIARRRAPTKARNQVQGRHVPANTKARNQVQGRHVSANTKARNQAQGRHVPANTKARNQAQERHVPANKKAPS